ncbi:hypothetical protein FJZ53_01355 [Candidatus Woesearchaeota archaeon]|nr:hypothetical protein [Candidatus Woesearchaeota archaeon]
MYHNIAKYSKLESGLFNSQGYQPLMDYSPIEKMVKSYSFHNMKNAKIEYKSDVKLEYNLMLAKKEYDASKPSTTYTHISVNDFLNPDRPITQFIGKSEEVKHYIEEAFEKTAGEKLPQHIIIRVVTKDELKALHEKNNGVWSEGIMGFAINKTIPEIFVRENHLDALMLTLGHELGHVFTKGLANQHSEEAKAFAFEMAWIKTIIEYNIAGLKHSFNMNPNPAKNGLHDVAFSFVKDLLSKGKKAIQVYWDLARGIITVENIYTFEYKVF